MASFSEEKDLNSLPFLEMSLQRPCSILTSDRNPSHLISKNQSECEKGLRERPSVRGWKCGRNTTRHYNLATPESAHRACAALGSAFFRSIQADSDCLHGFLLRPRLKMRNVARPARSQPGASVARCRKVLAAPGRPTLVAEPLKQTGHPRRRGVGGHL